MSPAEIKFCIYMLFFLSIAFTVLFCLYKFIEWEYLEYDRV